MTIKIIDNEMLNQLSRQAAESERLRKNLNLHDDYADPCQRLFNAMEPGTYIRPHRHSDPPKPECFMAIRGKMALVTFHDDGRIKEIIPFGAETDICAIELPPAIWHSLVSLQAGSIFFETKPGPYIPLKDKDFAPWAPEEGSRDADAYLADLQKVIKED